MVRRFVGCAVFAAAIPVGAALLWIGVATLIRALG